MTEEDGNNNRGLALKKAVNGWDINYFYELRFAESVCEFVYSLPLNDERGAADG